MEGNDHMNNVKKHVAILLTLVMVFTLFATPVFTQTKTPAQKLETLGILVGAGQGVTPGYLAGSATRITSAILFLKLRGLISNAEAWTGTVNFADQNQALSNYARTMMGYLKNNPALGFIGYQNNFSPNAVISAQEYYKVLLTALGYFQDTDYTWAQVISFAASKGLTQIASKGQLTINDFAIATVEALDTEIKGTGMTLLEKLIIDGVVDVDDAQEAGWNILPELGMQSVTQTSGNKIQVAFTIPVNTSSAIVRLKQGVVYYYTTVAWNTAKNVATLTTAMNPIPAGTYTVEVTGLETAMSANVTTSLPIAASVEITTPMLYDGSTTIAFAVKNQFGEAMAVPGTSLFATAYKTAAGQGGTVGNVALAGQSDSTFTYNAANTVTGDVMQITLVYGSLAPASKTFTIQTDPSATAIAFGNVSPLTGKSNIFVNDVGLEIPYTLYDQYGVQTKLPIHTPNLDGASNQETIGQILFISSDNSVVNPDTFAVNSAGKLTFTAGGTAGTAKITALWKAAIVGEITITVTGNPTATTTVITAPTGLIAGGDTAFNIPIAIIDQFGNPVSAITGSTGTITATASSGTVTVNSATTLRYTPATTVSATTTVTIDIYNGATKIGTGTFQVQPNAVATVITSVNFTTLFQAGASLTVPRNAINVIDQYGRTYTGGAVAVYDGAAGSFTVSAPATINAVSIGSDVMNIQVGGTTNFYSVTVGCIADSDITNYSLTPSKTTIYASTNPDYHASLTLTGKAGTNNVVLRTDSSLTYTSGNFSVAKITANKVEGVAAGTTTISAFIGATPIASTTIIVSTAVPVAQSITFSGYMIAHGGNLASILVINDQYGVNIAASGNYAVASSNTAIINSSGVVTNTTGSNQVVSVTVVKDALVSATVNITVTPGT